MQGLLLGLATGTTCLATCAPVLIPFLLGEGRETRQNWGILAKFLGGRLGGYLLFGLLAWVATRFVLASPGLRSMVFGATYVLLSGLLLLYGLVRAPVSCAGAATGLRAWLQKWPAFLPVGLGFLTGLNLCPPFLLALTSAAGAGTLLGSLIFFVTFFLGTSLYFVPLPFLGAFNRVLPLRTIGRFAAVIMALYYLYSGIVLLTGGVHQA